MRSPTRPGILAVLALVCLAAPDMLAAATTGGLSHLHAAAFTAPLLFGTVGSVAVPSMTELAEQIAARMAAYDANPNTGGPPKSQLPGSRVSARQREPGRRSIRLNPRSSCGPRSRACRGGAA